MSFKNVILYKVKILLITKLHKIIKYFYLINQYAQALLSGHPDASTSAILFP
jgi:hypothetical protein